MGRKSRRSNAGSEYVGRLEDREELLRKLCCAVREETGSRPMGAGPCAAENEETALPPMMAEESGKDREIVRKRAVTENMDAASETASDILWKVLMLYQGEIFYTVKGLEFMYYIKGNELFVNRKDKSITRASVDVALQKAMDLNLVVSGPKKLTCFGASYLYPIFLKLGIIVVC